MEISFKYISRLPIFCFVSSPVILSPRSCTWFVSSLVAEGSTSGGWLFCEKAPRLFISTSPWGLPSFPYPFLLPPKWKYYSVLIRGIIDIC